MDPVVVDEGRWSVRTAVFMAREKRKIGSALGSEFVFFSSRRRHTRSLCDWSSDVCSSDLCRVKDSLSFPFLSMLGKERLSLTRQHYLKTEKPIWYIEQCQMMIHLHLVMLQVLKIGRASCRERV